jgi:steroid delta-isomerase-like uncharacterized protein
MTQNKQIALDHYKRLNAGDVAGAAALIAEDCVNHAALPTAQGRKGFATITEKVRSAMPDMSWSVEDALADGDKVVVRLTIKGTQTGAMTLAPMPLPPTGKAVKFEQIHILRVANGQIVEHWMSQDTFALFRQLGVQVSLPS